MGHVVQRGERFYAVVYDGIDPFTGKERRSWHAAGSDRADADAMVERLDEERRLLRDTEPSSRGLTFAMFLINWWLPAKKLELRATTFFRYEWMVDHYVTARVGGILLRRLRADHLEQLYTELLELPGRNGTGLSPKTVHNVHVMLRSALRMAVRRKLLSVNVADAAVAPKYRASMPPMRSWTVDQLVTFLDAVETKRMYPAYRVSAMTGMRRGEVLGLRWSAIDFAKKRLVVENTVQLLHGTIIEQPPKTRSSRRSVDLDDDTLEILAQWRASLEERGTEWVRPTDWVFPGGRDKPFNPDLYSQIFDRLVARLELPKIRLHDLRHTHASLLIKDGEPVKVVSERLGHANPAFTMTTYQHVMPGMGANAARRFAKLVSPSPRHPNRPRLPEAGRRTR